MAETKGGEITKFAAPYSQKYEFEQLKSQW